MIGDLIIMKTFSQWAAENKYELPELTENATKRAGIAGWAYPSSYVRGLYPDLYFTPYAADAPFKLSQKPSDKAAPEGTPG